MSVKKMSSLFVGMIVIVAITMFIAPARAQANAPLQTNDGSQCVTCHEDLYYLHDTGKAYCLKDSPMTCVDCHGGDPTALTKETAHFNRAAHPVINDNDKKCYECHPAEAGTRLDTFRQVAGIPELIVVEPCETAVLPVTAPLESTQPAGWVPGLETVALFLFAGLALLVAVVIRITH